MAGENQPLAGRVAIVTGAGAGIGAAIAAALAEAGAAVAVADIDEASAAATARVIEGKDRPVIAVRADVSEARDVRAMVERALADLGGVDILVNLNLNQDARHATCAAWRGPYPVKGEAL